MNKNIIYIILLLSLLVTTVSAEGTSIILDSDQTTQISGNALILCSVAIMVFAALIIIKVLLMSNRE